jgi:hypothetical protein
MEQNETKRRNETETLNIIHQTLKSRITLEPKMAAHESNCWWRKKKEKKESEGYEARELQVPMVEDGAEAQRRSGDGDDATEREPSPSSTSTMLST